MNDFVNFKHRGVSLPPGFNDLADLLAATKASSVETPTYALHSKRRRPLLERYETDGLKHSEKLICKFLESSSKKVRLGFILERGQFAFTLVRFPDRSEVVFCFTGEDGILEQNVRGIFAEFKEVPCSDASFSSTKKHRVVVYPIEGNMSELLKVMIEVLRRAFHVSDSDGLAFILQEQ
jgi:hypothetical protein